MNKLLFTAVLIISNLLVAIAGNENSYEIGKRVKLNSGILNEERELIIYIPASYEFSNQDYPVLYLLDGEAHFHHATGIVQFLSSQGLMPEMIVVSVVNTDRNKDFTPTKLSQRHTSGGADKFMDFFQKELFPMMDSKYRTSDYRILMGHSLGGAFATYALLERPSMFNSYISISPYLMYDNNYLIRQTIEKLKPKYDRNIYFYMTVGNEPTYFETLDFFAKTLEEKSPKNLNFKYDKRMEDNHGSSPHLTIYNGLLFIFSDWKLDEETISGGMKAIDKHYKSLSETYGVEMNAPEPFINLLGYRYLAEKNFEEAIKIFKENVKRYPESSNVYDSLGEAYEKSGNKEKAKENYSKAVALGKKTNSPNLNIYLQNLERVAE